MPLRFRLGLEHLCHTPFSLPLVVPVIALDANSRDSSIRIRIRTHPCEGRGRDVRATGRLEAALFGGSGAREGGDGVEGR
jgi:hypothetical protein